MMSLTLKRKLISLIGVTVGGCTIFAGVGFYKAEENFYKKIVMPLVHFLEPERAHNLAIFISKHRLIPKSRYKDPENLKVKVFGKCLSNPIGIAAGFDKDGKAILGLDDIGFGFVEVGSITPLPQPGNDRPRVFRLEQDKAIINRYGFNSEGHEAVLERLKKLRENGYKGVIGINLGKNKTSTNAASDYIKGVKLFGPIADYLVINISSPNTPGLRSLQNKDSLKELLTGVNKARNCLSVLVPVLLKIAPDLSKEDCQDIAEILKQPECKVDGLIVCNTTIQRPPCLKSPNKNEVGGLSGQPLNEISTKMIRNMSNLTNGMLIIGVGGISSGKDAYEKIKAGASIIQIYSAMTYEGPPIVEKIKRELCQLLEKDGFSNISEAVGKGN